MNKNLKRIISIFLSFIMLFLLGFSTTGTVLACDGEGDEEEFFELEESGTCGKNVKFTYDSSRQTLEISGTGAIPASGFSYYEGFSTVIIKEGITGIGEDAFAYTGVVSVTIPDSVTDVGNGAFKNCLLKTVSIGKGVKNMTYRAFSSCDSLESITVSPENDYFSSEDGVLFTKDLSKLILFPRNKGNSYCIPDGVVEIGEYAFEYSTGLKSITIPDSVVKIGESAFEFCMSITSITMSNCLETIGAHAFKYCYDIKNLTIPASVTSIGTGAFESMSKITSVVLPEGLTRIESSLFSNCKKLSSVAIPDSVSSIGHAAFLECQALKTITLPMGLTDLGKSAFNGCYGLTAIELPDGLIEIHSYAFKNCSSLETVTGGENLSKIGDYAFYNCGLVNFEWHDSLKSIGKYAFYGNKLTDVIIPEGVTTIGEAAFARCTSMTELVLPDSLNKIEKEAFGYCNRLYYLTLGNNVTYIGDRAFANCRFTSVNLSDSLETIGDNAFEFCNICDIQIPSSVTEIGESPFWCCYSLNRINVDAGNSRYCSVDGVLFNKAKTVLLEYPIGCEKTSYTVPYGVEKIGNYAFYNSENINKILITDTVREIGSNAFSHSRFKTLELTDNIEKIGAFAFYNAAVDNFCYNGTTKKWWKVSNKKSDITCPVICTNGTAWVHDVKMSDNDLTDNSYVYDGKVKKPEISMKNAVGAYLCKVQDFNLSYSSGRKNVGKYSVKITYCGDYEKMGTQTLSFTIVPQATSISSISSSYKAFTVNWKKQSIQTTGYQVRYSRSSSMSGAKTVTISRNTTLSKKVTGLSAKKKYYVQVRTYKTVNGSKFYSKWSAKKTVTTK